MSDRISEESIIIQMIVELLLPFILLLGFFVIINGHYTPGGGFQGGSILATLFVARYVIYPVDDTGTEGLHTIQRVFLTLILVMPPALLFSGFINRYPEYRAPYLTLMDILIGVQVGFGVGVAILRFAFFQGIGTRWKL